MTPIDFSQVSILIVDDDELSQSFLEGVLRNRGCQHVLVASDAQQAIELMQRHRPDFVTLDIYMPDVDGWALLKQIRKISASTRIVMVTGSSMPEDFEKSILASADGYCIKPVLPDLMIKALTSAMNRH